MSIVFVEGKFPRQPPQSGYNYINVLINQQDVIIQMNVQISLEKTYVLISRYIGDMSEFQNFVPTRSQIDTVQKVLELILNKDSVKNLEVEFDDYSLMAYFD